MDIRRRSVVFAIVLVMLMPSIALAEAPPNDTFETATAIEALPYSEAVDLSEATDDPRFGDCETGEYHRIWYRYTAPEDQVIQLSVGVHPDEGRVEYALWDVTDGDPERSRLIECSREGHDLFAKVIGGRSYAFVLGQDDAGPPWFAGTLTADVVPTPDNDDFADATPIADGESVSVTLGTSLAATRQIGEPKASCDSDEPLDPGTLWYRLDVSTPSIAIIPGEVGGIAAFFSGDDLGSLSEVACVGRERQFEIAPGTYWVQLSGRPYDLMTLRIDLTVAPPNDDFADATSIGALPYQKLDTDLTLATVEATEPTSCSTTNPATAWWTYTATAKGRLTFSGSGYALGAWSGAALDSLVLLSCAYYGTSAITVHAGDVIHLQLAGPNIAGPFSIQVDFAAAPANDDFADAATVGDLPFEADVDLSTASFQPGEPTPSCYATGVATLWYSFTAPGASTSFSFDPTYRQAAIAAYTGTGLDGLTQIGCAGSWSSPVLTINPPPDTTVWIQVAVSENEGSPQMTVRASATGAPIVDFFPQVSDPSIYTDIPFYDATSDPGGASHTSSWTFGDGSTSTDQFANHRYAKDGSYVVTLSVVTADGRTGSATKTVVVRTHDVAIVGFDVPTSVHSGETTTITVHLGNQRYREIGSVQLSAIRPGGYWENVDQRSGVSLPVTRGTKTTDIKFKYRFTKADAAAGKVSFSVSLLVDGVNDVAPGDNLIIAPPTFVTR